MSRSVVPALLAVLGPYLASRAAAWRAHPDAGPTLPHKRQGRIASIHVTELVGALGVNPEWRQHFRKREVRDAVNSVCREQGLVGIGETATEPGLATATWTAERRDGAFGHCGDVDAALIAQASRIAELEGILGLARSGGVLVRPSPATA